MIPCCVWGSAGSFYTHRQSSYFERLNDSILAARVAAKRGTGEGQLVKRKEVCWWLFTPHFLSAFFPFLVMLFHKKQGKLIMDATSTPLIMPLASRGHQSCSTLKDYLKLPQEPEAHCFKS